MYYWSCTDDEDYLVAAMISSLTNQKQHVLLSTLIYEFFFLQLNLA